MSLTVEVNQNQKQNVHLGFQISNASDIIDILLSQMLVAC